MHRYTLTTGGLGPLARAAQVPQLLKLSRPATAVIAAITPIFAKTAELRNRMDETIAIVSLFADVTDEQRLKSFLAGVQKNYEKRVEVGAVSKNLQMTFDKMTEEITSLLQRKPSKPMLSSAGGEMLSSGGVTPEFRLRFHIVQVLDTLAASLSPSAAYYVAVIDELKKIASKGMGDAALKFCEAIVSSSEDNELIEEYKILSNIDVYAADPEVGEKFDKFQELFVASVSSVGVKAAGQFGLGSMILKLLLAFAFCEMAIEAIEGRKAERKQAEGASGDAHRVTLKVKESASECAAKVDSLRETNLQLFNHFMTEFSQSMTGSVKFNAPEDPLLGWGWGSGT